MNIGARVCAVAGFLTLPAYAQESGQNRLPAPAPVQIDFARDIKPIFENSCYRCHGPEKPKSGFRLDSRESALKGGENGVDIRPGDSAKSALVLFVAGLDPDMQMPPTGKGAPLNTNQIALLRAWIDQGVAWETVPAAPTSSATFVPEFSYVSVSGNVNKFREQSWQRDGWNGGLAQFDLWERTGPDSTFSGTGHVLRDDYKLQFTHQRDETGFIRYGWEQYRKNFDGTGGLDPAVPTTAPSLNRDLHLDIGRAWIDFGLVRPDWPLLTLGYEYQYKQGQESDLAWGYATATGKAIAPASQDLKEHTHILKLDVEDELLGYRIEDGFRAEFYHLSTHGTNIFYDDTLGTATAINESEGYHHFQGDNTIRVERRYNDWLFASSGYRYNKLDGTASASVGTLDPLGIFPANNLQTQPITLESESHVANLNALLGPWDGLTISTGVQGELTREQGSGVNVLNNFALPTFSDYDTALIEENLALHYSKIPFTALFAEARLRQERIGETMGQSQDASSFHDPRFLLETEFTSQLYDLRVGFNTSPWTWASLSAHYRRYDDQSHYNNEVDQLPLFGPPPGLGYPGFIRARDMLSDEIETKLVLRPVNWLKATLGYKLLHTDYRTDTDLLSFAPGFADISDGGELLAGRSDSHIYSVGADLTPHRRLYLSALVSYQDSKDATTLAGLSGSAAVVPYQGTTWSALGSATYVLGTNTDLMVSYSFSESDYAQNNFAAGLPLGLQYQQHALQAGLSHRINKNLTTRLQYGYFQYTEPTSGGAADYRAHSILASLILRLR